MLFQKAFDVGVHCGINSYVTTITHPFDRSGSDDVETFINQHSGSYGTGDSRRWPDVETQLPVIVLRVELIVGGMSIDIEYRKNGQKPNHPKVRFLLMECFIFCDFRIVERGLQVDDDQGPIEELTP